MKVKPSRSSEEQAIVLMRLLTHWLNFWINTKEEGPVDSLGPDFGIVQIKGLKKCLDRVEKKLEKEKREIEKQSQ